MLDKWLVKKPKPRFLVRFVENGVIRELDLAEVAFKHGSALRKHFVSSKRHLSVAKEQVNCTGVHFCEQVSRSFKNLQEGHTLGLQTFLGGRLAAK